ncbi:hypothetical protein JRQ81_016992, partial [Phrynocephalus forsythii]
MKERGRYWDACKIKEGHKLHRRLLRDGSTSESPPGDRLAPEEDTEPAGSDLSLLDPDEDRSAVSSAADPELSAKLSRRQDINTGTALPRLAQVFNPYTEIKEFTRQQINDMERMFRLYDSGKDGYIDLMELKLMIKE